MGEYIAADRQRRTQRTLRKNAKVAEIFRALEGAQSFEVLSSEVLWGWFQPGGTWEALMEWRFYGDQKECFDSEGG